VKLSKPRVEDAEAALDASYNCFLPDKNDPHVGYFRTGVCGGCDEKKLLEEDDYLCHDCRDTPPS
jgi:hypothetical protein